MIITLNTPIFASKEVFLAGPTHELDEDCAEMLTE